MRKIVSILIIFTMIISINSVTFAASEMAVYDEELILNILEKHFDEEECTNFLDVLYTDYDQFRNIKDLYVIKDSLIVIKKDNSINQKDFAASPLTEEDIMKAITNSSAKQDGILELDALELIGAAPFRAIVNDYFEGRKKVGIGGTPNHTYFNVYVSVAVNYGPTAGVVESVNYSGCELISGPDGTTAFYALRNPSTSFSYANSKSKITVTGKATLVYHFTTGDVLQPISHSISKSYSR